MFRSALALRFALFRTQRLQPLPEPSQVAVADLVTEGVPWPITPAKNAGDFRGGRLTVTVLAARSTATVDPAWSQPLAEM